MPMLKSTHEAVVKELNAEIARTGVLLTGAQEDLSVAHSQRRHAEAERDAALAELAPLKADRERANQGLAKANLARKLTAIEKARRAENRAKGGDIAKLVQVA